MQTIRGSLRSFGRSLSAKTRGRRTGRAPSNLVHLQGAPKNPRAETARSRDTLSCACAMGGGGGGLPLPEPTVSVVDVDGQPTEVIETMSLVRSMPALDVVVFPGNPGSAQFYVRYMQYMHETLLDKVGCVRIRAVSHLGHARGIYKPSYYTLEDQVHHKVRFLETNCNEGKIPLLVVGHSIGGYMAIEAVKRWAETGGRDAKIASACKILALMPYMEFDESSPKQTNLERVAQRPYIPATVASALGFVPRFALVRILAFFDKNLDADSAGCVADQLLSYTVSHNAFSLAQDEFRSLRTKSPDFYWLRKNRERIGWVFCPDDHWAPEHLYRDVCDKLGKEATFVRFSEEQFHGFCTSAEASRDMAAITLSFLDFAL